MKQKITFQKLLVDQSYAKTLQALGIHEPTPVQERSLPIIQDKKDLICQSSTGSGKTLAFALPIAESIDLSQGLQALILVPTRELCEQVTETFRSVTVDKKINTLEIYGGVSIDNQIKKIPRAHIVVATPGRVCDLLNRRALRFDAVKTLVLDEADRMLDMGFIKDVETIIRATPRKRQTLMFSATLPRAMQHIIKRHMHDPQKVKTKEKVDKQLLKQYYYVVPVRQRFHLLVHLLKQEKAPYAIVFCGTRRAVDLVTYNLNKNDVSARAIHGGLTQAMRKQIMSSFHGKNTHILVATDIAARGLDIKLLSHVYNFDVPRTPEEYVHRIGRTARAGEEGVAITLVSEKDYENFRRVQYDSTLNIQKTPLPKIPEVKFVAFIPKKAGPPRRQFNRNRRVGNRHTPRFPRKGRKPQQRGYKKRSR